MKTISNFRFALCAALVIGLSVGIGCGGGSSSTPASSTVAISVSPASGFEMNQGGTQAFTATVTGTTNTAVSWSVNEGAVGGSITSQGVYTAPNKAGTFHIIATSQADTSKSVTTEVDLPAVAIGLNNSAITIDIGQDFPFVADVAWTVNQAVTWSVQEGPSGGSITASGVYTAPGAHGTYHVIAASQADTTQTATAIVTVAPLSVSVSPSSDVLGPAGVRTFGAGVTTSLNSNVNWGIQGGTAGWTITPTTQYQVISGGTVTSWSFAQYTAPANTGSFHPVATSVQDPSKSGTANVTIVPSGFRPTGNMTINRAGAADVLLQSGKVLVAGGYHRLCYGLSLCNVRLSSAELYDPASGTFAATGNMSVARGFGPTATLLTNGKVLVAGGSSDASAELYDPTTGTFAITGSMSIARNGSSATLLHGGKVLVVGGSSNGNFVASAELYDPTSGTFTATGSMATARSGYTATLLANGKVLISGGSDNSSNGTTSVLATAELYDPLSGSFSLTASMTTPRTAHAATLLATGNVLMTGGQNGTSTLASAEIYDATIDSFSSTTSMMVPRASHAATLLPNGSVLEAGGGTGSGTTYTAELYDPSSGVFTQTGSMETSRMAASAVLLLDGRVLVSGGGPNGTLPSAEVYK